MKKRRHMMDSAILSFYEMVQKANLGKVFDQMIEEVVLDLSNQ